MKTILGINGAAGRMGQRLVHLIGEDNDLALGAALEAANHPLQGRDIGEIAGLGKLGVPSAPTCRASSASTYSSISQCRKER